MIRTIRRMRVGLIAAALALAAIVVSSGQARKPADLTRAGWDALNAGRLQEASAAFSEALKSGPTPPALLGAALAAHLQSRYEEARQHLVSALSIDPTLIPASILLGEVLYRSGDLDGAILDLRAGADPRAGTPQISEEARGWRKELALHSRFGQRFSDHFTVLFEGPAEAAARRAGSADSRSRLLAHRHSPQFLPERRRSPSCCTPANSSAISPSRRNGPVARSTAGSGCPSRVRCRTTRSSSAS